MFELNATRLRAVFDLAIEQLHDDARILEAAGRNNDSDHSIATANILTAARSELDRFDVDALLAPAAPDDRISDNPETHPACR